MLRNQNRLLHYLKTGFELKEAVASMFDSPSIGVDIEADSLYHYQAKICLIQISSLTADYLIDPLAIDDMSLLASVFTDPSIEKIFHASDYDLRCLNHDYRIEIRSVFDTKIAADLLGLPVISLAGLLKQYFGIELTKRFQKYDWSRRPLSLEAQEYAISDVQHLIELKSILKTELERIGRLDWALQEFDHLEAIRWKPSRNSVLGFWKLKNMRRLPRRVLPILYRLWEWREKKAQSEDVPVFKILSDELLVKIVQEDLDRLKKSVIFQNISRYRRKEMCSEIYEIYRKTQESSDPFYPENPEPRDRPPSTETRVSLKKLREIRDVAADAIGIEPGVLASRESLEILLKLFIGRNDMQAAEVCHATGLRPWQWQLISEKLNSGV